MNNLKRVLALGLSGVMLSGMMMMGAGAANKEFTDAEDITHIEAVDVMSTLGVLAGKDTGAFDPKGTVTRAEMAKIICVMRNGGVDPTLGTSSSAMFTDTANHWARSYIEYCANLGIIAGQGDGTFNPDGQVTGAAAAKMLLVALGYDSDVFQFTGMDWELNVNLQANDAKLYDEIRGIDTSAGLSRDNTAQMAYNALEARIMDRTFDKVASSGEISYNYFKSDETFLNEYFNAYTFVGKMDGNSDTLSGLSKGTIQVTGRLDTESEEKPSGGTNNRSAKFPSTFSIDNVGEEVKVIFKDGKSGTAGTPDKNDTIFGIFNTGRTEVIRATQGDVKDLKTDDQQIKIGDVKYDVADTVTVITNFVGTGTDYTGDAQLKGDKDTNSTLTAAIKAANGNPFKCVTDEDGAIDRIYITSSKLAVVTSKNSEKVTMNNGVGTLTIADNDIYEDVKKDDVVVVTTLYATRATDDDAYTTVTKAEKISGEVEGFKTQENVTLDGDTYKVMNKTNMLTSGLTDSVTKFDASHIEEDFDLYMVNGYVAAAVQTSESASNYSVILEVSGNSDEAGSTFGGLRLRVMDAEGLKTNITVSDDSTKTVGSDYGVGDIVTYTTNKDGEAVVKIEADYSDNTNTGSAASYSKSTKSFNDIVTSSDCVLFSSTAADTGSIKAYNIRSLGNVSAEANKWTSVEKDGKIVAVFTDLGEKPSGATSTTVYGIVSADNGTRKVDDTTYNYYVAQVNGESYTLYTTAAVNGGKGIAKGDIVSFEPASDNIYDTASAVVKVADETNKVVSGYVDEYSEGDAIITIFTAVEGLDSNGSVTNVVDDIVSYQGKAGTSKVYAIDDDVNIYFVDVDNDKGVESGSVSDFDTVTGYKNIVLILAPDGSSYVVSDMIVEVSGEADIY